MLKKAGNFVLSRLDASTYSTVRLGVQIPCGLVGDLFEHSGFYPHELSSSDLGILRFSEYPNFRVSEFHVDSA
jgi:hypothetical protein